MTSRLEQLCLDKGLKMTEQRRVIAQVLSDSADHPDVEQVYRRATAIDSRISIATVYRTVRLFEEANILARHDFGDGRSRYEEMPSAHHDHLIDLQSGRVIEFRDEQIEKLQEIYDPEIPVNIWDLGLIYEVQVLPINNVQVLMTLTAPSCPAAQTIPVEVDQKVREIEGVNDVHVSVTWTPPWDKSMMSEAAQLELGFL